MGKQTNRGIQERFVTLDALRRERRQSDPNVRACKRRRVYTQSVRAPAADTLPDAPAPSLAAMANSVIAATTETPFLKEAPFELESVELSGGTEVLSQSSQSIELWTQKRIYSLDQYICCVRVTSIDTQYGSE